MRNRRRYPKHWPSLAMACKERAGWRCEQCHVAQDTERVSYTLNLYKVKLQAVHKNHDPHNEAPELVAVCPSCHWRHYRKPGQLAAWMIEKMKHQKLIAAAWCV